MLPSQCSRNIIDCVADVNRTLFRQLLELIFLVILRTMS
jgi:hypothetical protein